jgi:hypothetical protein
MKKHLNIISILAFAVFAFLAFVAATPPTQKDTGEENTWSFTERSPYRFSPALDTITNTEVDTLVIGGGVGTNFLTNYEGAVFATLTNVSGTTNVAIVVDEGYVHTDGTTRWVLGKDTLSGTGVGTRVVEIGTMVGTKYRLRLTGTGTQNTTYRVQFIAKPQ